MPARLSSMLFCWLRATHAFRPRALRRPLAALSTRAAAESDLDPFWTRRLETLRRPAAELLATKIAPNALGFPHASLEAGAKPSATLLVEVLEWKRRHPTKVLLVRVGEFYEAWGVDAVLLVEHCGLNAMGDKVRAGCPWRNLQQTLDGLTGAGLSVAVYEEAFEPNPKKKKPRFLSQVVTPGAGTYVRDKTLEAGDVEWRHADGPSFVAVAGSGADGGATVVALDVDARAATVLASLTPEGCRAAVAGRGGAAAPAFYFDDALRSAGGSKAQETNRRNAAKRVAANLVDDRARLDDDRVVRLADPVDDEARARALARAVAEDVLCLDDPDGFAADVRVATRRAGAPRPLFASTAREIGLAEAELVPALVPHLLPARGARAASQRFLRSWLLAPPDAAGAAAMRALLEALADEGCPPLPLDDAPNLPRQKLVRLLAEKEANAPLFRDLATCAARARACAADAPDGVAGPLLELLDVEGGGALVRYDRASLTKAAADLVDAIDAVVAPADGGDEVTSTTRLPPAFVERNEAPFRGAVAPAHRAEVADAYARAEAAAVALDAACADLDDLTYDVANNVVCQKGAPTGDFVAPLDRFRRPLAGRKTTPAVEAALGAYVAACADAAAVVRAALRALSESVYASRLDAALACVTVCEVGAAALDHAEAAAARGWGLPQAGDDLRLEGLTPYWLPRADAAKNDVSLDGGATAFLTGANAAGKSTLLRATAAAALLGAAGLRAPIDDAAVPHWDGVLLRAATGDAPLFGKSAFEREMDDVAALFRECSPRSLVLVDELGRGTSSEEGVAVGAAVLEEFERRTYRAVFATHLHEVLDATDATPERWRMGASYQKEAGVCDDSRALDAAAAAGVPDRVVRRAAALLGRPAPVVDVADHGDLLAAAATALEAATAGAAAVPIKRGFAAPPRLVGRSCVYAFCTDGGVYVGETDAVRNRLKAHEARFGDLGDALVVPVADKSAARRAEAVVLKSLRDAGVPLLTTADASHVAFGGGGA